MPRPGPRPYECVRRAWHSDRHQPIRGSLIQQIFRVVNEAHAAATKKNKEWQEKLPIVVLKAEEIMYSKANSEAEYTNLDTLWDRVNEAINTIIRREETTETGDLLPPCVEAALNLGCIPVRASRSQRHINPRTYLTPRPHEPPALALAPATRVADRASDERCPQMFPFHSVSRSSSFPRTPVGNTPNFRPDSNAYVNSRNSNLAGVLPIDANTYPNQGSVYPLYYGTQFQSEEHHSGPQAPETAHSKTIYVGTPVIPSTSIVEPSRPDYFVWPDVVDTRETHAPREAECDLSLRLGRSEKSLARETDDFGSSTCMELGKFDDARQPTSKEFCFFPGKPASDPFESGSRMRSSGGEGPSFVAALRKGKEPFSGTDDEDGQFCWQPGVPSNLFNS